jgi:hypothetical protein
MRGNFVVMPKGGKEFPQPAHVSAQPPFARRNSISPYPFPDVTGIKHAGLCPIRPGVSLSIRLGVHLFHPVFWVIPVLLDPRSCLRTTRASVAV